VRKTGLSSEGTSFVPQPAQNRAVSELSVKHFGHFIALSLFAVLALPREKNISLGAGCQFSGLG
jgi:hypothetical protein